MRAIVEARAPASGARFTRALRALGDAADRHASIRHAVLHVAGPAGSNARARRGGDDRQRVADARAAMAQAQSGHIVLPPPTWTALRELEPFGTVDDALAWARKRHIVRRQPMLFEEDGRRMLLMPGAIRSTRIRAATMRRRRRGSCHWAVSGARSVRRPDASIAADIIARCHGQFWLCRWRSSWRSPSRRRNRSTTPSSPKSRRKDFSGRRSWTRSAG